MTASKERAVQMRLDGRSYDQIAKACDISLERAFQWIREGARLPSPKEVAQVERAIQLGRLDRMLLVAIEVAEDGGLDVDARLKAVAQVVSVSARQAKLLGLDAPERLIAAMASLEEAPEEQRTPAKAAEVMRRAFGLVGPATDTGDIVTTGEEQNDL